MVRGHTERELPGWWRWAIDHEGLAATLLILAMPVCGIAFPAAGYGLATLLGWDTGTASFDDTFMLLVVTGLVFPIMLAAVLGLGMLRHGWVLGVAFGVGYVEAVLARWVWLTLTVCACVGVFALLRGLDHRSATPGAEEQPPGTADGVAPSPYSRRRR